MSDEMFKERVVELLAAMQERQQRMHSLMKWVVGLLAFLVLLKLLF